MSGNKSQFCSVGTDSNFSPISFHHPVEISFKFLVNVKKQKRSILSLCFFPIPLFMEQNNSVRNKSFLRSCYCYICMCCLDLSNNSCKTGLEKHQLKNSVWEHLVCSVPGNSWCEARLHQSDQQHPLSKE